MSRNIPEGDAHRYAARIDLNVEELRTDDPDFASKYARYRQDAPQYVPPAKAAVPARAPDVAQSRRQLTEVIAAHVLKAEAVALAEVNAAKAATMLESSNEEIAGCMLSIASAERSHAEAVHTSIATGEAMPVAPRGIEEQKRRLEALTRHLAGVRAAEAQFQASLAEAQRAAKASKQAVDQARAPIMQAYADGEAEQLVAMRQTLERQTRRIRLLAGMYLLSGHAAACVGVLPNYTYGDRVVEEEKLRIDAWRERLRSDPDATFE